MKPTPTIPAGLKTSGLLVCFCPWNTFNKKGCSLPEYISILQEGRPHFIHQLGLLSSNPRKIKSMSETRAEASTAPTEIENLVLLSANDISAFPKWSRTVVKEEHNRDMITGGTLASPFSCKTHSLLWLFMDYPNTHAYIHTPHSPLTGNDSCSSISCYPL